jgi:hypothetical protein
MCEGVEAASYASEMDQRDYGDMSYVHIAFDAIHRHGIRLRMITVWMWEVAVRFGYISAEP